MSRAAEILNMSRSAISQNIKELCNQLGVTLFTATNKGVIPTGEANNLYPTVKNAIVSIVEAENNLQAFDSESEAVIRIGLAGPTIEYCIFDYLKEFCIKYPKVRLEFFRRDIMELLANGKIDFVIELASVVKGTGFKTVNLFNINSTFIATKEFLKKRGLSQTISLNDFLRLPIISFHVWQDFFKQLGSSAEPFIIKTDSISMHHYLAKNSIGIGHYCKELLSQINDPNLVEVNIENLQLPVIEVVCGYNILSRPARAFIEEYALKLNR